MHFTKGDLGAMLLVAAASLPGCAGQAAQSTASVTVASQAPASAASPVPLSIKVAGNHLVDGTGKTVRLLGVNFSGQTTCTGAIPDLPVGIFEGPSDDRSIAQMKAWRINAVRIQLNESCWLGINGADAQFSGTNYRNVIADYARRLNNQGIYAIVDLNYNAPGNYLAKQSQPGPDADHAPDFWASVATTFKDNPAVLFDLLNEPVQDAHTAQGTDAWACWRDGCNAIDFTDGTYGPPPNYDLIYKPLTWRMAGMQQLVDVIRAAGAHQPVLLGGLDWSNDLSGFLTHVPKDPDHQLVAKAHVYAWSSCKTPACWTQNYGTIAQSYPVVTAELGESYKTHDFIDGYMQWADANGVSYLAWWWGVGRPDPMQPNNPLGDAPLLLLDYGDPQNTLVPNGNPPNPTVMGQSFHAHLAQVAAP